MPNRNWKIESLAVKEIDGTPNVVVKAGWSLTVTDGGKSFSASGIAEFEFDGKDFTQFDKLTEAQVVDWVQAQKDLPKLYANIDAAMAAEPVADAAPAPLPWVHE